MTIMPMTAPTNATISAAATSWPTTVAAVKWAQTQVWEPAIERGGDLGERMATAFADAFAAGSRRVALAGSDVPELTRERVGEAFSALDDHDMALGPAADGGYYLVALARPRPALFEGVAWSTERVLAETLERAAAAGLRVRLLGTLRDVDTPEDARRFAEEEASHARR